MSENFIFISMPRSEANKIIEKVKGSGDCTFKVNVSEFPTLRDFPIGYLDKVESITYSTSACPGLDMEAIMVHFHRRDSENIDQDLLGIYYDNNTGSPSISGCIVRHGNWEGRTQPSAEAKAFLDHITTKGVIPLSESPESFKKAFGKLNPKLVRLKTMIDNQQINNGSREE